MKLSSILLQNLVGQSAQIAGLLTVINGEYQIVERPSEGLFGIMLGLAIYSNGKLMTYLANNGGMRR